jgi:flagellar basal-body rod protein FlgG
MYGTIRSGMATAMHELAVISNNISNAGSIAFQRSDVSFTDLYGAASAESVQRLSTGLGSAVESTRRSISQGNIVNRDGVLNVAMSGSGLFVTAPPTTAGEISDRRTFTRNGEFSLDANGDIKATDGSYVMGFSATGTELNAGALTKLNVPYEVDGSKLSALEINKDGSIYGTYGQTVSRLGQLGVATFPNPLAMRTLGLARFEATVNSGDPSYGIGGADGYGQVQSGALESSNVDMTVEMTSMIRAQQQFSGAARILQTNSDMIEKLTQR